CQFKTQTECVRPIHMPPVSLVQHRRILFDNLHSSMFFRVLARLYPPRRGGICAIVVLLLSLALPTFAAVKAPNGTDTNPLNLEPEVQAAYQHFYNLDYDTAQTLFEKIAAEHPTDPMAAGYVMN